MKKCILFFVLFNITVNLFAQVKWKNVDSLFQPLPQGFHVYYTNDSLDGKPNIAYYAEADLKNKNLIFTADTAKGRRLTPTQYFEKDNQPLLVINCTFFEFVHNSNLNLVIKDSKILSYNHQTIIGKGKDTLTYKHVFSSTLGIDKNRNADVAWTYTDPSSKYVYATQTAIPPIKDSVEKFSYKKIKSYNSLTKWKMQTAVGGGPVLLQNGEVKVTNNEELKFTGKGINDKHPRTCMGYTKDDKLIVMVIEGRNKGKAEGATLTQQAQLLQQLGCVEALNLDGGGSSCMLINGKQTIKPSDKEGQRPVPAVFLVQTKNE
ncbi:MAG: phosphodiester glycosidase family protein [Bacteroidetes bacterium]|nr:phosphodiester glycosidase family protein [Bacteroidota bacterium]MBS1650076.1 phosphodiester glycosidase family protein [Bacteroidota bacterium]